MTKPKQPQEPQPVTLTELNEALKTLHSMKPMPKPPRKKKKNMSEETQTNPILEQIKESFKYAKRMSISKPLTEGTEGVIVLQFAELHKGIEGFDLILEHFAKMKLRIQLNRWNPVLDLFLIVIETGQEIPVMGLEYIKDQQEKLFEMVNTQSQIWELGVQDKNAWAFKRLEGKDWVSIDGLTISR